MVAGNQNLNRIFNERTPIFFHPIIGVPWNQNFIFNNKNTAGLIGIFRADRIRPNQILNARMPLNCAKRNSLNHFPFYMTAGKHLPRQLHSAEGGKNTLGLKGKVNMIPIPMGIVNFVFPVPAQFKNFLFRKFFPSHIKVMAVRV